MKFSTHPDSLRNLFCFFLFFICADIVHAQEDPGLSLPTWLEEHRSLGHTGLGPAFAAYADYRGEDPVRSQRHDAFWNGSREMAFLGAPAYVRHIKTSWQPPLFNSSTPAGSLTDTRDFVSELVEDSPNETKTFAYYWDGGEGLAENGDNSILQGIKTSTYKWTMPREWLCKDLSGKLVPNGYSKDLVARGFHADLAQPEYRRMVLTRLIEMVDRGVSGFYFDERHFPAHRENHQLPLCFGSRTEELFLNLGKSLPTSEDDPNYRAYAIFQGKTLANFIKYLRTGLAVARPTKTVPIIFSGTYLSSFTLPHMSLTQAQESPSVKIEYLNGLRDLTNDFVFANPEFLKPPKDIRLAMGLSIPRDAADGRPPTVWAPPILSTLNHEKAFIDSILAYGGIVQLHVPENYLSGARANSVVPDSTIFEAPTVSYSTLKAGYTYLNQRLPIYAHARPSPFAAIHLSERMRNNIFLAFPFPTGESAEEIWRRIMWPATAAFGAFMRLGLPVNIITDEQILNGDLQQYQILFTFHYPIAADIKEKISAFAEQEGKKVIFDSSVDLWKAGPLTSGSVEEQAEARIQRVINEEIKPNLPNVLPIQVVFPSDAFTNGKPQATFQKLPGAPRQVIVSLLNDYSWLVENNGRRFPNPNGSPPSPLSGVKVYFAKNPAHVFDYQAGRDLVVRPEGGRFSVAVPEIATIRVLRVEF